MEIIIKEVEHIMNFKIKVKNPEHSKQIQELCFENGIYWFRGGTSTVGNTDRPYIYVYVNSNYITHSRDKERFNKHENKEVTLEKLRAHFKKEEYGKAVFHEDKLMRVWDGGSTFKHTRVVFGKKNGKYLAWNEAESLEGAKEQISTLYWEYAEEIPTQISRKEIAEKFDIEGEFEITD